MSNDLVWQIVKKHHAFLVKSSNGATFSGEPGNLMNLQTRSSSGLANMGRTVAVNERNGKLSIGIPAKKLGNRFIFARVGKGAAHLRFAGENAAKSVGGSQALAAARRGARISKNANAARAAKARADKAKA